jgi:hypothetical protein
MHNIPDKIFSLVEQYTFAELSTAEKNLVLQHLSEEDYTELHEGFTFANAGAPITNNNFEENKTAILAAMQSNVAPAKMNVLSNVRMWQAAAVLFAVSSLALWLSNSKRVVNSDAVAIQKVFVHDTILQQQAPLIQTIKDTVYLTKVETKYLPTQNRVAIKKASESTEKTSAVADSFNRTYMDSLTKRIGFSEAEVGMGTF